MEDKLLNDQTYFCAMINQFPHAIEFGNFHFDLGAIRKPNTLEERQKYFDRMRSNEGIAFSELCLRYEKGQWTKEIHLEALAQSEEDAQFSSLFKGGKPASVHFSFSHIQRYKDAFMFWNTSKRRSYISELLEQNYFLYEGRLQISLTERATGNVSDAAHLSFQSQSNPAQLETRLFLPEERKDFPKAREIISWFEGFK